MKYFQLSLYLNLGCWRTHTQKKKGEQNIYELFRWRSLSSTVVNSWTVLNLDMWMWLPLDTRRHVHLSHPINRAGWVTSHASFADLIKSMALAAVPGNFLTLIWGTGWKSRLMEIKDRIPIDFSRIALNQINEWLFTHRQNTDQSVCLSLQQSHGRNNAGKMQT